jgi:hypothetical protein
VPWAIRSRIIRGYRRGRRSASAASYTALRAGHKVADSWDPALHERVARSGADVLAVPVALRDLGFIIGLSCDADRLACFSASQFISIILAPLTS